MLAMVARSGLTQVEQVNWHLYEIFWASSDAVEGRSRRRRRRRVGGGVEGAARVGDQGPSGQGLRTGDGYTPLWCAGA